MSKRLILRIASVCCLMVAGSGCAYQKAGITSPSNALVAGLYRAHQTYMPVTGETRRVETRQITLSVDRLPFAQAARLMAIETGVSLGWSQNLDPLEVTLELSAVPLDSALSVLARRVDADLSLIGDLYFIGEIRPEDRAVLVRRCGAQAIEGVATAIGGMLSQYGTVETLEDGTVIVSDKVEVLTRVSEVFNAINGVGSGEWVVQFLVLERSEDASQAWGIEGVTDAALSVLLSNAATATGKFTADLHARAELIKGLGTIQNTALLHLREGVEGSVRKVERIPVPERSTTDTGAVVVSGYTDVEIGATFKGSVRAVGTGGSAVLMYDVDLGELVGFVEEVPRQTTQVFKGETTVVPGGAYLLGMHTREVEQTEGKAGLLTASRTTRSAVRRTFLVGLVEHVQGLTGDDALPALLGGHQAIPDPFVEAVDVEQPADAPSPPLVPGGVEVSGEPGR